MPAVVPNALAIEPGRISGLVLQHVRVDVIAVALIGTVYVAIRVSTAL